MARAPADSVMAEFAFLASCNCGIQGMTSENASLSTKGNGANECANMTLGFPYNPPFACWDGERWYCCNCAATGAANFDRVDVRGMCKQCQERSALVGLVPSASDAELAQAQARGYYGVSVVYCKRKRNILWNVRVFRGIIEALKQQTRPI